MKRKNMTNNWLSRTIKEVESINGWTGPATIRSQGWLYGKLYTMGLTAKQAAPIICMQFDMHNQIETYKELAK